MNHKTGLYVHNDTVGALGRAYDQFSDQGIVLVRYGSYDLEDVGPLVQWLQAQHVLCVPVDAALRASYGYTCSSCMPQVADEE